MNEEKIIFVSAGMLHAKKKNNPVALDHAYLNYGLLGLASIVKEQNHNVALFHGKFTPPKSFLEIHSDDFNQIRKYPLFLSLPSSISMGWAREFVRELKAVNPDISIVVGGRWVVMQDGDWIKKRFNNLVDLVVYGLSEDRILQLLDIGNWESVPFTNQNSTKSPETWNKAFPRYNYLIMPDYMEFQPSIEVSRGCGMGCSFCLEGKIKPSEMKSPKIVIEEIKYLEQIYGYSPVNVYLEASHFKPTKGWAEEFSDLFRKNNIQSHWRAETRADCQMYDNLSLLAEAGLKILDIGLESASCRQLVAMGKTNSPEKYLEKASKLLVSCAENGIWTKVNILLYPGENEITIDETITWLDAHSEYIKGVSINPLTIYRNETYREYLDELKSNFGAYPAEDIVESEGYCNMHLSPTVDYPESERIRIKLCQKYMSADDYYDLKTFSYFTKTELPRQEFIKKCNEVVDKEKLPFSLL